MKDQYANYVVQKVLETCDGQQRELLLSRIRVHLHSLRKYTYGKHIVARVEKLIATGGNILILSRPCIWSMSWGMITACRHYGPAYDGRGKERVQGRKRSLFLFVGIGELGMMEVSRSYDACFSFIILCAESHGVTEVPPVWEDLSIDRMPIE